MRKLVVLALGAVLALSLGGAALAADSAPQTVDITVEAINEVAVSGNLSLTVNATTSGLTAGDLTLQVTDSTTTLSYSTNEATRKIIAQVGATLPTGIDNLTVAADANPAVSLDGSEVTPANFITGISNTAATVGLTYALTANLNLVPASNPTITVTYTLTTG